MHPVALQPSVDITLEETVQHAYPAIEAAETAPETPLPDSPHDEAAYWLLGELAGHRHQHGAAPVLILLNPLTLLEIALATRNWDALVDPADGLPVPLVPVLGLGPREAHCVDVPMHQEESLPLC